MLKLIAEFSLTGVTFLGIILALCQWKRTIKFKRADYINELTEKIRTDEAIKQTVYMIDYGAIWYNEAFHGSKELEVRVDKTLSYFSYICYLKMSGLITKREFRFFKYEINRILVNQFVKDYFYNLYHFAKRNKAPMTFDFLFRYGKRKHMFDKDFFDENAHSFNCRYHHYLNF